MSFLKKDNNVEMFVAGIVVDPASNSPIVILKDTTSDVCLPIWIGINEATSIASALQKVQIIRPMTHDLIKNITDLFEAKISKIHIHKLKNNTFYSKVEFEVKEEIKTIDSRPSDAIALAVRSGASIMVAKKILDTAKVTLVTVGPEDLDDLNVEEESLDTKDFSEIDQDKWEDILAEMNPDDFKYKM